MGKAKKIKVTKNVDKGPLSLADQIDEGEFAAPTGRIPLLVPGGPD